MIKEISEQAKSENDIDMESMRKELGVSINDPIESLEIFKIMKQMVISLCQLSLNFTGFSRQSIRHIGIKNWHFITKVGWNVGWCR